MMTRNHSNRIAMGAALLMLAALASSCGTGLPTAPALDSGVSVERGAQTSMLGPGEVSVIDDPSSPAGGPDVTQKPPAGEEQIPQLTPPAVNGHAWGRYKDKHKPH